MARELRLGRRKMKKVKAVEGYALTFKEHKPKALNYPWIGGHFRIFTNLKCAQVDLAINYSQIIKHIKIIPVLISPLPKSRRKG